MSRASEESESQEQHDERVSASLTRRTRATPFEVHSASRASCTNSSRPPSPWPVFAPSARSSKTSPRVPGRVFDADTRSFTRDGPRGPSAWRGAPRAAPYVARYRESSASPTFRRDKEPSRPGVKTTGSSLLCLRAAKKPVASSPYGGLAGTSWTRTVKCSRCSPRWRRPRSAPQS